MRLSPHTLLLHVDHATVLLYQCALRKGFLLSTSSLTNLWASSNFSERVEAADVTGFSLADCLLDNPAGIVGLEEPILRPMSWEKCLEKLREYAIVEEEDTYLSRMGKKTSLFDRQHEGNFHQDIGSFLFSRDRKSAEQWWIAQKFNSDFSGLRETPYRWVQKEFLDHYIDKDLAGQDWLDFGCGIGFYSHFLTTRNATVLGVDPSLRYIQIAREHFTNENRVNFQCLRFECEEDFLALKGYRFDRIFLCDVFLYYFEPYQPMQLTGATLLEQLRRILKPGGRILIVDPHGSFHLQPWMATQSPYLICTEYKNRKYRVTPTLEEVSKAAEAAGLTIRRIRELTASAWPAEKVQAWNVTREFPLWWAFELEALR